ncbi:hypothetical protein [Bradyrhizobium sp. AZCC 1699]|uniref:hypothetical protein n=1 Tax=Bradyrhizobium sp. AZCC 1699 TaxID=3117024 RepID=UPI002FF2CC97
MSDDLAAYLKALPDRLTEQLSDVLREEAFRLSDAQRQTLQSLEQAPSDTGDLEASCTVAAGRSVLEYFVQAGGDMTTKEIRTGSGEDYDYAVGFEHGNSRQPARPFFYSTFNSLKDDMAENINDAVNEVLK